MWGYFIRGAVTAFVLGLLALQFFSLLKTLPGPGVLPSVHTCTESDTGIGTTSSSNSSGHQLQAPPPPACAARALLELCKSLEEDAELMSCYNNPLAYFHHQYKLYVPSSDETKARRTMHDHQLSSLSVGSGKAGLCDDIRPNKQTVCTDRPTLDLFKVESWMNILDDSTRDPKKDKHSRPGIHALFAEHVLEHFTPIQAQKLAAVTFLALQPGGTFRVAVPDGYKPSNQYQNFVRAGSTVSGHGQNHMVVWAVDSLPTIFQSVGFDIEYKEHFDLQGTFHTSPEAYVDDATRGKIKRSSQILATR